jgi:hypothetical protein
VNNLQKGRQMIDCGDVLVDKLGQLFTPDGEPIWVTEDGRHIPLTKLTDEHLLAIQDMLRGDVTRWGRWIGQVDAEITRRGLPMSDA